MASAEHRWGEQRRARVLLDRAEEIVGTLPPYYERIRSGRDGAPARLLAGA